LSEEKAYGKLVQQQKEIANEESKSWWKMIEALRTNNSKSVREIAQHKTNLAETQAEKEQVLKIVDLL
jgi:hypothetical protein